MIPKMDFTFYLLNENRSDLGQKTGDVLSALQNLHDDAEHLGTRQILKASQNIIIQIRKILRESWPDTEMGVLKNLQKIGVALSKAIDENTNLKEIIASAVQELESLTKGDTPVNDLGSDGEKPEDEQL